MRKNNILDIHIHNFNIFLNLFNHLFTYILCNLHADKYIFSYTNIINFILLSEIVRDCDRIIIKIIKKNKKMLNKVEKKIHQLGKREEAKGERGFIILMESMYIQSYLGRIFYYLISSEEAL